MTDLPDAPFFDDDDPENSREELDTDYAGNQDVLDAVQLLEENIPRIEDPVGVFITLYDFYTELEKMEDAGSALVEASRRISPDHHGDLAFFLYNQLELFSQLNADAQSAYERLGHMIAEEEGDLGANTTQIDQRKLFQQDLIPEILLARHLHRMHVISEEELYVVLQDLCWCVNRELTAPKSVLYVMEDRVLPHHDKAIEFMAHDCSVPFLDLRLVKCDPEVVEVMPLDFTAAGRRPSSGKWAGSRL